MIHMDEPIETTELLAFARTVEAQSLSGAALELGVPRATIGRRLARLEKRLGVRLLRRTTRRLALTDAGEILYRHAINVLSSVRETEESVRRKSGAVRGVLRVSVPSISDPAFHDVLCEFAKTYPEVRMQLDFSSGQADIQGGRADVALRAAIDFDPGLVSRMLGRTKVVAVASPDYLREHGTPTRVADLAGHSCLLGFTPGGLPKTHWPLRDGKKLRVEGTMHTNDVTFLRSAAVRGRGIALLPSLLMAEELAEGELVPILEKLLGATSRVALVYADKEFVPPAVRAFVDVIAEWAKDHLLVPAKRPRR